MDKNMLLPLLILIPFIILFIVSVKENLAPKKIIVKSTKVVTGRIKQKTEEILPFPYNGTIHLNTYAPDFVMPIDPPELIMEHEHDIYVEEGSGLSPLKIMVLEDSVFDSLRQGQVIKAEIKEIYISYPSSYFKKRRKEQFSHWQLKNIL